ncbi:MAG: Stp1/IreP family PP2C-type Ser/Thr phosphatase [Dehalococcoidia bacterium]|nr:Stp1/IreP family PP2C-type Ser/Thr phosphatase [Dehalococcoidia bacterium]
MGIETGKDCLQLGTDVGAATDTGVVRQSNEDSLLVLDLSQGAAVTDGPATLLVVADGMGGYEGGEIASSLAANVMSESVSRALSDLGDLRGVDAERVLSLLVDAVLAAADRVFKESQVRRNGMGTTLVAAMVVGCKAYVVNVGDSRAYLLRGDELRQVTADHSLVASLVSAGLITVEEMYTHPQRNVITRCLGSDAKVAVDGLVLDLKAGDHLMLCSDGLWEMVRDGQMKDILLKAPDTKTACQELVSLANQNGGEDNISVIVAGFRNLPVKTTESDPVQPCDRTAA